MLSWCHGAHGVSKWDPLWHYTRNSEPKLDGFMFPRPSVVFCCCSSVLRFNKEQRCSSAYLGGNEWLFEWLLSCYRLTEIEPFSSGINTFSPRERQKCSEPPIRHGINYCPADALIYLTKLISESFGETWGTDVFFACFFLIIWSIFFKK